METLVTRTVLEWLQIAGLGAVLGLLGQIIRTAVGLKKLGDDATASGKEFAEIFSVARLVVSLLIGAAAGMIAALSPVGVANPAAVSGTVLLGLLAAGYSGADFIEGFARNYLPGGNVKTSEVADAGSATVSADGSVG